MRDASTERRSVRSTARSREERRTWQQMRVAIAQEFIEKLPEELSLREVCELTGESMSVVLLWIQFGVLAPAPSLESFTVRPADNLAFFMREQLLRMPLPGGPPATRTLLAVAAQGGPQSEGMR